MSLMLFKIERAFRYVFDYVSTVSDRRKHRVFMFQPECKDGEICLISLTKAKDLILSYSLGIDLTMPLNIALR